jgi:hypothetical protein
LTVWLLAAFLSDAPGGESKQGDKNIPGDPKLSNSELYAWNELPQFLGDRTGVFILKFCDCDLAPVGGTGVVERGSYLGAFRTLPLLFPSDWDLDTLIGSVFMFLGTGCPPAFDEVVRTAEDLHDEVVFFDILDLLEIE